MTKLKPWLWLPAQWSHTLSPYALAAFGLFFEKPLPVWKPLHWKGLLFKNPLGLAGGVDKSGDQIQDWWKLGAGFVEVGTVTPEAQNGNPGKTMDRDSDKQALWNRMGFPSDGMDEMFYNLTHLPERRTPILVNIGKNRHTPNSEAVGDYLQVMDRMHKAADIFVINISSPNTKGLRDLQSSDALAELLKPLMQKTKVLKKPLIVKLSPDMESTEFARAIQTCVELGVDGFVLTNTTLSRYEGAPFPAEGGVSGAPLRELSKKALRLAIETLGPVRKDKLIISVGGVLTPEDVFERLNMGADLVETYSGIVYDGPLFFQHVHESFQKLNPGQSS